jgi:HAE1 family hydrophobic/amphiphilic exporter-1
VLVVGGQSLCLLLTLLAVPVFYSLFDDATEWQIIRRVNGIASRVFGGLKRKVSTTAGSIFSKQ